MGLYVISESEYDFIYKEGFWGAWVSQLFKRPTHDFSSGHDLKVMRLISALVSTLSIESA